MGRIGPLLEPDAGIGTKATGDGEGNGRGRWRRRRQARHESAPGMRSAGKCYRNVRRYSTGVIPVARRNARVKLACNSAGSVSLMRRRRATSGNPSCLNPVGANWRSACGVDWHGSITPSFGCPGRARNMPAAPECEPPRRPVSLPIYTRISACAACYWRAGRSWGRPDSKLRCCWHLVSTC